MIQLKKWLLYAGLEREEFDALLPAAVEENRRSLRIYAMIALALFSALVIADIVTRSFAMINMTIYIVMAALMASIFAASRFLTPSRPRLTTLLGYVFMCALYAFSLQLTLLHPDKPAVTTIVLLLAIPFLMLERPIYLAVLTSVVVALICVLSIRYKDADTASTDTWNAISFGLVGIAAEVFQMRTRFRVLSQNRKIKYLGETDTLTGAKNRNHYEERRPKYANRCKTNLACAYIDVNGLHELNNSRGHQAGDEMLQAVARQLIERFGAEDTYRIGGDEFICFRADAPDTNTSHDMTEITEALKQQGYDISWGVSVADKDELDLNALVAETELKMFQAKREYYQSTGKDRRRR